MNIIFREVTIWRKKLPLLLLLWFALTLAAVLAEVLRDAINNYLIYKYVFWHVVDQKPLYAAYPPEYFDVNHYGPSFSLLIAPFALMPDWLGCFLWAIANAAFLYYAISRLPLSRRNILVVVAITVIELMTAIHNVQFNPMLAAWIILAYALVEDEKDFWATLLIAAGFLVKLYGIAALLFFVFSKHKLRFVLSGLFWLAVLSCLPMLYSSPQFIVDAYKDWITELVVKNAKNTSGLDAAGNQDISVMGMVRRITHDPSIGNLIFLAPAAALIVLPLIRFRQYAAKAYRLSYLAVVLISVVIFSTSAESATYVIAVPGAALWYVLHRKQYPAWSTVMLVLLFLLTILSPTDLVPPFIRKGFIRPYSLKALPCFLIWIWLILDLSFKNFLSPATAEQQL